MKYPPWNLGRDVMKEWESGAEKDHVYTNHPGDPPTSRLIRLTVLVVMYLCEESKVINLYTVYCSDSVCSIQNGTLQIPVARAVPPTIQLIFVRFLFLLYVVSIAETLSCYCCGSVDGAAVHLSFKYFG